MKELKFFYFSSHKLPKQQSTNFWSQGILGVKETEITTRMWYMMGVVKNLLISMTWKKKLV
jgi:hypothetical protein